MVIVRDKKSPFTVVNFKLLTSDVRLLRLFIIHHNLRDSSGRLLGVNSFLYSLFRCYFDERVYPFGVNLKVNLGGDLDEK